LGGIHFSGNAAKRRQEESAFGLTQTDLNNGRIIRKIGMAAERPVKFVIFRICG
jgi:phage tail sheath protein FI